MIAAARETGERHAELQARNWRVADLFELGDMPAFREEVARHARLADELRLPSFQWYTPLWAAVEALLAGRYEEAERLADEARELGVRAGDRNADLFADMLAVHRPARARASSTRSTSASSRTRSPTPRPAPPTPPPTRGCSPAAARRRRARATLDDRDRAPARVRRQLDVGPGRVRRGLRPARRRRPTRPSSTSASRPTPAAPRPPGARSPATARSTATSAAWPRCSAAATTPSATCRTAIARNHELGCTVWAEHAERWLERLG